MATRKRDIIRAMDTALAYFDGETAKSEKAMFETAMEYVKLLETDKAGNIKTTTANIKRLTEIKSKLESVANNKEYAAAVKNFVRAFGKLADLQMSYYRENFAQKSFGEGATGKYDAMKTIAVNNVVSNLTGAGLTSNVTDPINDMLLKAVTSGAKWSDLVSDLNATFTGVDGGSGALTRYTKTYSTTALTQFVGQNNKLLTDDLGVEWFEYVGSTIETTRDFCNVMVEGHPYVHKSEFEDILAGRIYCDYPVEYEKANGEKVSASKGETIRLAIYQKTGLPYGMIDGTTPDNFQINVGGWNCKHQLIPISTASVPKEIRERIEKGIAEEKNPKEKTDWEIWYENNKSWLDDYAQKESRRTGVDISGIYNKDLSQSELQKLQDKFEEEFEYAKDVWSNAYYSLSDVFYSVESLAKTENDKNKQDSLFSLLGDIRGKLISYEYSRVATDSQRLKEIREMNSLSKKYAKNADNIISKNASDPKTQSDFAGKFADDTAQRDFENGIISLESALGIKRGDLMTYEQADKQHANPNYGKQRGYGINCQTCAPAYMLRLQGFNVTAKPNIAGSQLNYLSNHWASCWKTTNGTQAEIITFSKFMNSRGYKRMNASRYREFFDEECKEVGVYEIGLTWKGRGGHCTIIERMKDGTLRYIEPQFDNSSGSTNSHRDIDWLCKNMTERPLDYSYNTSYKDNSDGVVRIDNKVFDIKYISIFDK